MDYLVALGSLFIIHLLALVSPGPNVLVVTQIAMRHERRAGIYVSLGLATGAAIWSGAALMGLNVIFEYVTWLYGALRTVGGCYLIFLGIKLWRAADEDILSTFAESDMTQTYWQSFRLGLLTTLTNPKAGIFFAGIFAAILPPMLPLWVKLVAIGLVVADSAVFHASLAVFFSTERVKQIYSKIKQYVDRLAGAALTFLGLRILLGNR